MKKNRKILLFSIAFMLVALALLLPWLRKSRGSRYYFEKLVVSPVPQSVSGYRTLYFSNPTLGEGLFRICFRISPDDFELIMNSRKWTKNDDTSDSGFEKSFEQVFDEKDDNIEVYHYKIKNQPSSYGELWIITNKEHDKVIIEGQI